MTTMFLLVMFASSGAITPLVSYSSHEECSAAAEALTTRTQGMFVRARCIEYDPLRDMLVYNRRDR